MSSHDRRAAGRRRAWGRGPMILRFEPLEGRQLLTGTPGMPPDLVAAAFHTSVSSLNWGESFHAQGTIQNIGAGDATSPFQVDVFASTSPTLDPKTAVLVGTVNLPALGAGAKTNFDQVINLPATPVTGASQTGPLYIGLVVDPTNVEGEANTTDKVNQGQGIDSATLNIAPDAPATLVGTGLSLSTTSTTWGSQVTVTETITNNGTGDAPATRALIKLAPTGATLGGPSDFAVASVSVPAIPAGKSTTITQTVTLPAVPPAVLAGSNSFTLSIAQDADGQTSAMFPHVPSQGAGKDQATIAIASPATLPTNPLPDLAPTNVQAPVTPVVWGQPFQASATIQNLGQADSGPITIRYYLAASPTASTAMLVGSSTLPNVNAGAAVTVNPTLTLTGTAPAGLVSAGVAPGYILVQVDPDNSLNEMNKANNVASSPAIEIALNAADAAKLPNPLTTTISTTVNSNPTPSSTSTNTHPAPRLTPAERRAHLVAAMQARREKLATLQAERAAERALRVFPRPRGRKA